LSFELKSLSEAAAKRFAHAAPWSRERLAAHAGKSFTLVAGLLVTRWRIAADGSLESMSPADAVDHLRLSISPLDLSAFLAEPARFRELVREEGDSALARDLESIAGTLPWLVEQRLADAFGPIAGARIAAAGRSLLAFPREAIERIADNVLRYAHDESRLLATSDDLRTFAREIDALVTRARALEARVAALEPRSKNA
jgi:ubiquinone biosynthesis protein UbiJ